MSILQQRKTCVIIGAGVSGLVQAAELIRRGVLKHEQLAILELAEDYGGVWKAATYPGAACDAFGVLYQISWFKNPYWSGLFPTSHEFINYYNRFADHFRLRQSTVFNHRVTDATWSARTCLWKVLGEDTRTGQRTLWQCDILIQAAGTYNRKNIPAIDGMQTFNGDIWHTVDWPKDYDFSAKRVAYIGTGPTSLQALPVVQSQAEQLTIFVRSVAHCHPFPNLQYPAWLIWIFASVPGVLALYSALVSYGFSLYNWFIFRPGTWLARAEEWYCERYLKKTVPDPALQEKLRPVSRFGAKRPLVSPTLFKLAQKSNVELIQEQLMQILEDGIFSKPRSTGTDAQSELHEKTTTRNFDVIIWGTGFIMQGWGSMIPTRGRQGRLLSETWGDSPETLFATMTPDFPNMFILNGPNTVAPWSSIINGIEYQALSAARLAAWILKQRGIKSSSDFWIEPKRSEAAKWTADMQEPLDRLAPSAKFGPGSYYLNQQGRNTFFTPFTLWYFWWRTRRVQKGLYDTSLDYEKDSTWAVVNSRKSMLSPF